MGKRGDNIPDKDDLTEEVAECPVCGAIIPADAKVCPECGAVFEDEEEGTEVSLEEEPEEGTEEEETGEEENEEEVPEKANKKVFWIGLITLLIGSQGIALGSLVHNTFHIFVTAGNKWNPGGSAKVYGYLDQMAGMVGIVITIIGIVLLLLYMKQQGKEERYREEIKEEKGEEEKEPLLVQNKIFFWIGLILLLITGPVGVAAGLAGGKNVAQLGMSFGIGGGGILTIIGIILIFLAIWQKKAPEEASEENEEEEYGEEEEEPEEDLEDLEDEEAEETGDEFEE